MNVTQRMREYARDNLDVAADADDATVKAAISDAMIATTLTSEKMTELMVEDEDDPADQVTQIVRRETGPINAKIEALVEATTKVAECVTLLTERDSMTGGSGDESMTDADRLIGEGSRKHPRVKTPIERYGSTRKALVMPAASRKGIPNSNAGQPVYGWNMFPMDAPSKADLAVCGAWAHWQIGKLFGRPSSLEEQPEHLRDLIKYAMHEMEWSGPIGGENAALMVDRQKLTDDMQKAVLDDSTSGGTFTVPQVLDDTMWMIPLLFGELLPHVDLVTIGQGSQVDGFTWTDVASITSSGTAIEGTAFTLPTTDGLISNLDTSIFPQMIGIELGNDFMEDSVVNMGQIVTQRFGEQALEWLDNQIANGDGTTEPTGIFTKSGVTSVGSANGTSGPYAVNDVEGLAFGLSKAMRTARGGRVMYVMSDTAYRRYLSVPVGTSDARRVFSPNMTHAAENYMIAGRPVRIQDNIAVASSAFWNAGFYRLYRRQGMTFRVGKEGQTLQLKNTTLITARMRYGGQPTLASSIAKMTDGDSTDG